MRGHQSRWRLNLGRNPLSDSSKTVQTNRATSLTAYSSSSSEPDAIRYKRSAMTKAGIISKTMMTKPVGSMSTRAKTPSKASSHSNSQSAHRESTNVFCL